MSEPEPRADDRMQPCPRCNHPMPNIAGLKRVRCRCGYVEPCC